MLKMVVLQIRSSKNNEDKNKTALHDTSCQTKNANILPGSNKIQEIKMK